MAKINHEKLNRKRLVQNKGYDSLKEKPNFKRMISLFDYKCSSCNKDIKKGSKIRYYFQYKKSVHANCKTPTEFK